MSKSSFCLVTLLATTLTGCVAYQAREINPAATQARLESRNLGDAGLGKFIVAHGQSGSAESWDLERLTLAAFYFSPELDVARAQLAEAEAGVRTAAALPNPSFNFSPGYNKDATGGVSPWILGYALDLPLELAGKRTYRTAEARQQADAARFEVARVAWSVRAAVRQALSDLHAADETAAFWREQKPLLAQAVELVQAQVNAGEISPLQAAQMRITLNRAELSARENERAAANARSRLAAAVGVPFAALAGANLSYRGLDEAKAIEVSEARRWAAQNRADLLTMLAGYAATQSALQGEIARQYPDLSFGPGYQLDQGEGKWSLSLGVTLPVFHQNQGPIAAAQARRETAAAKFLALQHRVLAEVDRAAAGYASAVGDLETVGAMRGNLELQARTARAQQAAGEISRLDVIRTQLELADSARAALEARIRAELAQAALEDAVQRPVGWTDVAWRIAPRPHAD